MEAITCHSVPPTTHSDKRHQKNNSCCFLFVVLLFEHQQKTQTNNGFWFLFVNFKSLHNALRSIMNSKMFKNNIN